MEPDDAQSGRDSSDNNTRREEGVAHTQTSGFVPMVNNPPTPQLPMMGSNQHAAPRGSLEDQIQQFPFDACRAAIDHMIQMIRPNALAALALQFMAHYLRPLMEMNFARLQSPHVVRETSNRNFAAMCDTLTGYYQWEGELPDDQRIAFVATVLDMLRFARVLFDEMGM